MSEINLLVRVNLIVDNFGTRRHYLIYLVSIRDIILSYTPRKLALFPT